MKREPREPEREKTLSFERVSRPRRIERLPCLQVLSGSTAGLLYRLAQPLELGRDPTADIPLDDPGVSWRHARLTPEAGRVFLEDLGSTNGTYVGNDPVTRHPLADGDVIVLGPSALVKFGYLPSEEIELAARLYQSATRDHLTGALNRGSFLERLWQEVSLGQRDSHPAEPERRRLDPEEETHFSVLMIDADHFKRINDTYGHPAGDAVLRRLAELLSSGCRFEDIVGRYGGEEFVVLCRNIGPLGAMELAERLRVLVESEPFWISHGEGESELSVTISLGVAAWRPGLTPEQLVSRADEALYQAKAEGRNRVKGWGI